MKTHIQETDGFLKNHLMHPDCINLHEQTDLFIEEMEKGLAGKEASSLLMLPSFISLDGDLPVNKRVIVIDAGGTNLRVAVVSFDMLKKPNIEYIKKYPMPGTSGELTFTEMCDTIAKYVFPIEAESDTIAFCFSYPTEAMQDHDAKIINFNKEVQITNGEGQLIGENLNRAMLASGCKEPKKIMILNDTIATLLGAVAAYPERTFDTYIGFILGTGTNVCYIEEVNKIPKVQHETISTNTMIINTESGSYDKVPRGTIDTIIDNESLLVGDMVLEKMISGGYLNQILLLTTKLAAREGLLSQRLFDQIEPVESLSMTDVNAFCDNPLGDNVLSKMVFGNDSDRQVLYTIIDRLYERAAKITTFTFAAIAKKNEFGKDPTIPICISAEGTTFYKANIYRDRLLYYMTSFFNHELGYSYEIVHVEDATIIGSAVAGLLN